MGNHALICVQRAKYVAPTVREDKDKLPLWRKNTDGGGGSLWKYILANLIFLCLSPFDAMLMPLSSNKSVNG